MTSRRRHRLQSWFALAILVLGMLAPGISAALSHARGDFALQDICSAGSPKSNSSDPVQNPALDMLTLGHCAMCHAHAADFAPPPLPAAAALLRSDLGFAMPERFYSAPVTAHGWRTAPARAPPASA
ncbi:DUF2946 family protein [Paucibacter sp. R3-3]|uniref:DUF2946 family protein n=1 Tax=Roseateles agri TaxID=3098619 RepID=A0ABU5DCE9_9BURK|nr:DUF2946 family protein [Paucibacter sp. R3-3]MDY0742964.1 DUF2946 family protein [Paucibacter sp. R3-3]